MDTLDEPLADRLNSAKHLLELVVMAVETNPKEQREIFYERSCGIITCCRIVQQLIEER